MTRLARGLVVAAAFVSIGGVGLTQETIENWAAPLLWNPPAKSVTKGDLSSLGVEAVEGVPTPPLHFVGLTPCRLVDTRGNGFTGQYGPPSLSGGVPRDFVLTGQCGINPAAQAVSLNVTVTNAQGPGFILIYPQGGAQPTVSTLNYVAGDTLANAAVVPLGAGGGITVIAGVSGTDLILDTNGDYRAGVVTSLNGLSDNVTLAAGSNVTITPAGQTLTVASTGGLPSGTANQTLRHDGLNWVASGALTNDGTNVGLTGALNFPFPVRVTATGVPFLHNPAGNTFLGYAAGAQPGVTGTENTAVGSASMFVLSTGSFNTALGTRALGAIEGGNSNTAVGHSALDENEFGSSNIAVGRAALSNITTGSSNIGIGNNVGTFVTTGNNNIYIGNPGFNNESGQIRIGDTSFQTGTVIVGIHGAGSVGGIPVIVNGGGRLGTTTSSARFKEDIRDVGAASDGLLSLRPVAFKYKESHEPGGLTEYGLIAEEVAEIYPELVVYDEEGRPQAIRSQLLDPLLLNEIQKQRREIEDLKARLEKLEGKSEP